MIATYRSVNEPVQFHEGPLARLERRYIVEYLESKGYRLANVFELPQQLCMQLMREACLYASLKLAEVEQRAQWVRLIHGER